MAGAAETVLVTGFPDLLARRLIAAILAAEDRSEVRVLVLSSRLARARRFVTRLPDDHRARLTLLVGDCADMDLGLSGREYCALVDELTAIHHLATSAPTIADPAAARRIDVEGTRGILELADECRRLRRLCHWSTARVSGRRSGLIREDDLDCGQGFHNLHEQSRMRAEALARAAMHRLPVSVFRPGFVIGDSATGEFDRLGGPHYLMLLVAGNATQIRLPLPGNGDAPFHVVPADYAAAAGCALARDERAAGHTFHLTDPEPLPIRRVVELVAERTDTRPPRSFVPGRLTRGLLRLTGLSRRARGPMSLLDQLDHHAWYDSRLTQEFLADRGIHCPPFESYMDRILKRLRRLRRPRPATDDDFDALD